MCEHKRFTKMSFYNNKNASYLNTFSMIARSSTSKCQCTKRKEILLSKTLSKHNTLMSSLVFSALKKNLKSSNFNNNNTIAPQVNLCVRCCCSQLTEKLSVGRRKRQTCTSSRMPRCCSCPTEN